MSDIWRLEIFLGMIFMSLVIVNHFRLKIGNLTSLVWIYFLIRTIFIFHNPFIDEIIFNIPDRGKFRTGVLFDQTSGQAFSLLITMPISILLLPNNIFKHWKSLFLGLGILNVIMVLSQGHGLMGASSFDASFLATLLPITPPVAAPFFLFSIAMTERSATAFVIIAVTTAAFALINKKYRNKTILVLLALLTIGPFIFNVHGFSNSGRLNAWTRFFDWFWLNANPIFGTGIGTFQWLGPLIDNMTAPLFLQMHSDVLQIFFEGGAIGILLSLGFYLYLLFESKKDTALFLTLISIGVMSLAYHPFRYFPTQLLIVCCIRSVFDLKIKPLRE